MISHKLSQDKAKYQFVYRFPLNPQFFDGRNSLTRTQMTRPIVSPITAVTMTCPTVTLVFQIFFKISIVLLLCLGLIP